MVVCSDRSTLGVPPLKPLSQLVAGVRTDVSAAEATRG